MPRQHIRSKRLKITVSPRLLSLPEDVLSLVARCLPKRLRGRLMTPEISCKLSCKQRVNDSVYFRVIDTCV